MATRARRSSGTNMYLNRLLFRKSRPDLDLEAFRAGTTFQISSMLRRFEDLGNPGTIAAGRTFLCLGQPIIFRGNRGHFQLTGPFELNGLGGAFPPFGRSFTRCLLSAAQGDYEFTVPTVDLDLVRLALALASGTEQAAPSAESPVTETEAD